MGSGSSKEKKKDTGTAKEKKKNTETAKEKAAKEKEIKSMTKECMEKGGPEWACRKGSEMGYKKMKKMKKKYDAKPIKEQILDKNKKDKKKKRRITLKY